jgi:hypothetical protein
MHAVFFTVAFHNVADVSGFAEHSAGSLLGDKEYVDHREDFKDSGFGLPFTPQIGTARGSDDALDAGYLPDLLQRNRIEAGSKPSHRHVHFRYIL